jgi:hypothetical protein
MFGFASAAHTGLLHVARARTESAAILMRVSLIRNSFVDPTEARKGHERRAVGRAQSRTAGHQVRDEISVTKYSGRTPVSGCQGLFQPVLVAGSHAFGRPSHVSPNPWPPAGLASTRLQ